MRELPTGTVTFLFTDIEGSTRLLQKLGDEFPALLDLHCDLLNTAIAGSGGTVVGTEGDSFFAVFPSAGAAIACAAGAQRSLASAKWPHGSSLRVRMGMHTGEGTLGGDNYTGIDVHRAARIAAAGHGGQVLLSEAAYVLGKPALGELSVKDLGEHRLKDLDKPEHIYQLVVPGLRSDFPPIHSLQSHPNNLPAQLTSFIGRRGEVEKIAGALGETRLLTLTGPGGTGKTRLSLEVGREMLGVFRDGVFFVELAPITDPSLVTPTIAETLGVRETGGRSAKDLLREHLAEKDLLLVMDNFEQVIPGAVEVADLLEAAPGVKALVTSRESLHVSGEQEYPVPPLNLPDPRHLPPLEKLTEYEAVALFIQRASAVRPGFTVTNENAPAVAEICARLDGLPLAIELAAARSKILSPQAILSRLESRLGLLTAGRSDLPARQQTLRNAIAWSYDLLDDSEKRLFRRLGVFVGGWTLEAAEAICSAGEDLDMVDALASLLDKSLVRQLEAAGEPRFMMLETIREYALEKAGGEDDLPALRRSHAAWFLEAAERAAPLLTSDPLVLAQVEAEHDNLRAVLGYALETSDAETGLRLGSALWRFWQLQGHFREGNKWLTGLLALPGAAGRSSVRAKGLSALGSIVYWQRDVESARAKYEECLSIYRELGDQEGIAEQLYNLAYVAAVQKDYPRARALYRESADLYAALGRPLAANYSEYGLAMVAFLDHAPDEARLVAEKTAAFFRSAGEKYGLANALGTLGSAYLDLGDIPNAVKYLKETVGVFRELGDLSGTIYGLETFAEMALTIRPDPRRAAVLLGAAAFFKEEIGAEAPIELTRFPDFQEELAKVMAPAEIEAARLEGSTMTVEEAVAFAFDVKY